MPPARPRLHYKLFRTHAIATTCLAPAGTFTLEMLGSTTANHPLAKCLSGATVTVACTSSSAGTVALTATAAGGNFIETLWHSASVDLLSYKQYSECPEAGTPVALTDGTSASLETAFENHVYGSGKPIAITSLTFLAGKLTVAVTAGPTLTYVITELSGINPASFGQTAADLKVITSATDASLTADEQYVDPITDDCPDGRYGHIVSDIKLCAVWCAALLVAAPPCAAGGGPS